MKCDQSFLSVTGFQATAVTIETPALGFKQCCFSQDLVIIHNETFKVCSSHVSLAALEV